VPADRLRQALFGELDAIDNILLPSFARLAVVGFRRWRSERQLFANAAAETSFPTGLSRRRGRQLSGGTQQKLVVGRWLKSARPVSCS
jgi:ribose transport system ATP-binding protein